MVDAFDMKIKITRTNDSLYPVWCEIYYEQGDIWGGLCSRFSDAEVRQGIDHKIRERVLECYDKAIDEGVSW